MVFGNDTILYLFVHVSDWPQIVQPACQYFTYIFYFNLVWALRRTLHNWLSCGLSRSFFSVDSDGQCNVVILYIVHVVGSKKEH